MADPATSMASGTRATPRRRRSSTSARSAVAPRLSRPVLIALIASLAIHALAAAVFIAAPGLLTGLLRSHDDDPAREPAGDTFLSVDTLRTLDRSAAPKANTAPTPPTPPKPATASPSSTPAPNASAAAATAAPATPDLFLPPSTSSAPSAPQTPAATGAGTSLGATLSAPSLGVDFAGKSARRARSVVYVVDASGPMLSSFPQVRDQLLASVAALTPTQRFGVVLFRGVDDPADPGTLRFTDRLADATPARREQLRQFLSTAQPRGRSNPLQGLRAAIDLKPQVIFLLSRSIERTQGGQWDLGLDATMAELDRLNPIDPASGRRPIIIKTIPFLGQDPTGIMQRIEFDHGSATNSTPTPSP